MARSNTASTSNWLSNTTATGLPLSVCTLSCWFNPANLTAGANLVYVGDTAGSNYNVLYWNGDNAYGTTDNGIAAATFSGGTEASAVSSTAVASASTWNHAAAVFGSTTSRIAYCNGTAGTANTTSKSPTGTMKVNIGAFDNGASRFGPLNGSIAEVCIWDVALTAAEIASLAKGFPPLLIRPNNIVRYWPIYGRGTETCRVSGLALTVNGTMAQAAHVSAISWPELPMMGAPSTGGSNKTLALDAASYVNTGSAVGTLLGRKNALAAGSYANTGQPVTLRRNLPLVIGTASYTNSGQPVTLKHGWLIGVGAGAYNNTGTAVTLKIGRKIGIGVGSYLNSGTAVGTYHGWRIPLAAGAYNNTGSAVTLTKSGANKTLSLDPGSYANTGSAVGLLHGWKVAIGAGSYTNNGQTVALKVGKKVALAAASYSNTGTAVNLKLGRAVQIAAGAYLNTGQNVTLRKDTPGQYSIVIEAGAYYNTGSPVTLTKTTNPVVPTDPGYAGYTVGSDRYMDRKWEREKARKDTLRELVLKAFRGEVEDAIEDGESPPTKTEIVEEAKQLVEASGLQASLDAIRSEVGRVMKAHADELERVRKLKKQQDEDDDMTFMAWLVH